jgi:hypothetical protein
VKDQLDKDLELAFTDHVLTFEAAMGEPDPAAFERAWLKLGDLLRRELSERCLWRQSPRALGVLSADHWCQAEAFQELLTDLYVAAILMPLNGLEALARVSGTVEGAVERNLRSFLSQRQRRHQVRQSPGQDPSEEP